MRQQTSVINAIHAHLAEFGAPVGRRGVEELLNVIANANDRQVPEINLKSAKALGLTLPSGLLSIVDEVFRRPQIPAVIVLV